MANVRRGRKSYREGAGGVRRKRLVITVRLGRRRMVYVTIPQNDCVSEAVKYFSTITPLHHTGSY